MISEATQTTCPSTKTQRDVAVQVGAPANMLSTSIESQVARVLLRLKHERVLHETVQKRRVRRYQKQAAVLRARKKTRAKRKCTPKRKKASSTVCPHCGRVFEKYQGLNAHLKVHRNAERRVREAAVAAAATRTVVIADTQSQ
ncbi:MAG: hypothetical protein MHM6MM_007185 [Cercozoa sp. M6MM]